MDIYLLLYIALGLFGASLHYISRRFIQRETAVNFFGYLAARPDATIRAFFGIVSAQAGYYELNAQAGTTLAAHCLIGAISSGYLFDNVLNKDK